MKKLFVPLFFIFYILGETKSDTGRSSCYSSEMTIFLDSASSFLQKAQGLNNAGTESKHVSCPSKPMDCEEILSCGNTQSGAYDVWPRSRITENKIQVYCDMATDGGGWTVFQRRGDYGRSKDYFYNDWDTYKRGFGKVTQDFWLGNDNIFALTSQRLYSLRIDLRDLENNARYAAYDNFWIDGEEYNYTLHVRGYQGYAGDSFTVHSGLPFTTKDRDNDTYEKNCAVSFSGAWWYKSCHSSNLNGLYLNGTHESYANGVEWSAWKFQNYSFPFVDMKIRSVSFSVTSNTVGKNEVCKV